jgi:hypothetical protein
MIKINNVWSWKKFNCSIKGEVLSWRPKFDHVAINKILIKVKTLYMKFKFMALFCHIRNLI